MQHLKGARVWADFQEAKLPGLRVATAPAPTEEKSSNVCVAFIEPRCHPTSEFVLRNIRAALPDTPIVVVHGTRNEEFMRTIVKGIRGSFEFLNCNESNLTNPLYNALLTSPAFWQTFKYEWVLTMQTDTVLLKPATQHLEALISKGIKFIGAPWSYVCNVCQNPLSCGCGHMIDQAIVASIPGMVGNGGLSLRHIPTMLKALDTYNMLTPELSWPKGKGTIRFGASNEDVFFSKAFTLMKETMPTRLEAMEFCVEQVAPVEWGSVPLGLHKPWVYLPPGIVKGILDKSAI